MAYYELTVIPSVEEKAVANYIQSHFEVTLDSDDYWENPNEDMVSTSKEFPGILLVLTFWGIEDPDDYGRNCYLNGEVVDKWMVEQPPIPEHLINLVGGFK